MTSLALCPEVVGHGHQENTEAVGILADPTALDAIGVGLAVEFVAEGEIYSPFRSQVQTVADLVFDACA